MWGKIIAGVLAYLWTDSKFNQLSNQIAESQEPRVVYVYPEKPVFQIDVDRRNRDPLGYLFSELNTNDNYSFVRELAGRDPDFVKKEQREISTGLLSDTTCIWKDTQRDRIIELGFIGSSLIMEGNLLPARGKGN